MKYIRNSRFVLSEDLWKNYLLLFEIVGNTSKEEFKNIYRSLTPAERIMLAKERLFIYY